MKDFFAEASRGITDSVVVKDYTTWVNSNDYTRKEDARLAKQFRAEPLEGLQGETVKDRDLIDGKVDSPVVTEGGRIAQAVELDVTPTVETDVEVIENPAYPPLTDEVPSGTIKKVLGWVGDDKEKAQAALTVENSKEDPRTSLIEKLEGIIED